MSAAAMALAAALLSPSFADPAYFAAMEGNRLYAAGRYNDALAEYRRAMAADPGSAAVKYNMGNTLYRLGKHEEAARLYASVISSGEGKLAGMAAFNRGAALYRAGEAALGRGNPDGARRFFDEAAEQYKSLLKDDPANDDARHNLELALERLEELEKQRKREDGEDRRESAGRKGGEAEGDEKGSPGGKESAENEGGEKREKDESRHAETGRERQKPSPDSIGKEEANRIFRAVEQDERALREKLRLKALFDAPQKEKDW